MAAIPDPVSVLLADLMRRGIELRTAPDGRLRYRPRSAMTPHLAARLAMYRSDLHAALSVSPESVPNWTPEELSLLDGCCATDLAVVNAAKQAFAAAGGVTVKAVSPITPGGSMARDSDHEPNGAALCDSVHSYLTEDD